jgi:uncharacterized protein YndB with AHSA1/START domain
MTVTVDVQDILVRKSVVVDVPIAHAFDVYTRRFNDWWPRSHHIGPTAGFTTIIEPRVGGRCVEVSTDGTESPWGTVLAYDPPRRVMISWDLSSAWQYDPTLGTEVDVMFVAEGPERTRVTLEHRKLHRYGDQAEMMRAIFDSENGWTGLLTAYAALAAQKS